MKFKDKVLLDIGENPTSERLHQVFTMYRNFLGQQGFDALLKEFGLHKTHNLWKPKEDEILSEYTGKPKATQRKLIEHGFYRTTKAIMTRVSRLNKYLTVIGEKSTDNKNLSNDNFTCLHFQHEQPQGPDLEDSGRNERTFAGRCGGVG